MFKAEGDYVYIVNRVKGPKPIVKVKCSPTELTVDTIKTIQCRMDKFSSMCYLPDVKCIAVSHSSDHVVKAIHCETGEEMWKVKGEVEGITWKPHNLCYLQKPQSLIVCDSDRLVFLNQRNGTVSAVLPVPNFGRPISMSLHDGKLHLYNKKTDDTEIYVYIINCL